MRLMHIEKYTLHIEAVLRVQEVWRVSMNQDIDPVFSFARKNEVAFRTEDAFEVRSEFLSLQSPEEAFQFFKRFGPFQFLPAGKDASKKNATRAESISWSEIQKAQKEFEEALLADGVPVEMYRFVFDRPLMIEVPFRSVTPELSRLSYRDDTAIAACDDLVGALRASIFLSRMRDFQWKRCARRGCNQLFEQDSKHQKIYHSPECAHLQAVNNYNARQKAKTRKSKKTKKGQ